MAFQTLPALGATLAIAVLVHGWIAAYDYYATTFTDSMDYLFMADFYRAHFHGGATDFVREYYRGTRYPPLFPLILGAAGAGTQSQHLASMLSNFIAVAAVLAVWFWVRIESRDRWLATGIAIALVLQPYFFVLNLSPVSEPLGILLVALAFAVLAGRPPGRTRILTAALLVGLAPLARAALLPLPLVFTLWLFWPRADRANRLRSGHAWLAVFLSWLPFAGWTLYRRLLGAQQYEQFLDNPGGGESLTALAFDIAHRFWLLLRAWHGLWCTEATLWSSVLAATLLALALSGVLIRMHRGKLDAWFVAVYLVLVVLWPFPNEYRRFLVLAYPFLLLCGWTTVESLASRVRERSSGALRFAPASLAIVALLLASAPAWWQFSKRVMLPVDSALLGEKREPGFFLQPDETAALAVTEAFGRARILLTQASESIPADACVYATPPQIARLYASRAAFEYPPDLGTDKNKARALLTRCEWYFVGGWSASAYGLPPAYPSAALADWTEPVLMTWFSDTHGGGLAAALVRRKTPAEEGSR